MAARINEFKQGLIEARAAHGALLDAHLKAADGKRGFTPDETKAQADAETLVVGLGDLVAAEQKRLDLATPLVGAPPSGRIEVGADHETERPWGEGPRAFGEFALSVKRAHLGQGIDPRLYQAAATGMGEALGPDGGFAIPVEMAAGIEREMFVEGEILSRVDVRSISGNAITYNVIRETSRADGSRQGGVLGYWIDEGEAPDATKFKLAQLELKLRKVGCLGYMTEELEQDALALGAELESMFGEELTFQVENKVYRGTGAGSPLGFLNAPCLVSVAKEVGQPAATIVPQNLSKMWARCPARSHKNCIWAVNVDCMPTLDELALPVGTAALEPRFVNYGPDGIMRIKGRPVIAVEYAETVGTKGDIALIDLSRYRLIRKAAGVQQTSSIHVRFAQGENTYRAIGRFDGQPVPRSAIQPFKGNNTLSPFVVLDTRA